MIVTNQNNIYDRNEHSKNIALAIANINRRATRNKNIVFKVDKILFRFKSSSITVPVDDPPFMKITGDKLHFQCSFASTGITDVRKMEHKYLYEVNKVIYIKNEIVTLLWTLNDGVSVKSTLNSIHSNHRKEVLTTLFDAWKD